MSERWKTGWLAINPKNTDLKNGKDKEDLIKKRKRIKKATSDENCQIENQCQKRGHRSEHLGNLTTTTGP